MEYTKLLWVNLYSVTSDATHLALAILDAEKFKIIDSSVLKNMIVLKIAIYITKISICNRIKIAAVN
jgi:hypothetical protein